MSDGDNTGLNNSGFNAGHINRRPINGRPINHVPPRTLNRRPNFINNDIGPAPAQHTAPQPIAQSPVGLPAQPTLQQQAVPPTPIHSPRNLTQHPALSQTQKPPQNLPLSAMATQSAVNSPRPVINNAQEPVQHRPTQHPMSPSINSQIPQSQHNPRDFRQAPITGRTKSKRKFSPAQLTLVGLGCAVFTVGIITSLNTMKTNNEAQAQLKALSANTVKSKTKKPTAVLGATTNSAVTTSNTTVAPDAPKTLIIPQMQLNGIVEPISLTATGTMAAPKDPKNVGWYSKSAKPGESPTVMIMNGSVGTAAKPGAFALLSKLAVNATFQVIRGDGKTYNYIVVNVVSFDPASPDAAKLLVPSKPGVPTLDLVTTGSTANGNDNAQGTIVYAEQQG